MGGRQATTGTGGAVTTGQQATSRRRWWYAAVLLVGLVLLWTPGYSLLLDVGLDRCVATPPGGDPHDFPMLRPDVTGVGVELGIRGVVCVVAGESGQERMFIGWPPY